MLKNLLSIPASLPQATINRVNFPARCEGSEPTNQPHAPCLQSSGGASAATLTVGTPYPLPLLSIGSVSFILIPADAILSENIPGETRRVPLKLACLNLKFGLLNRLEAVSVNAD